MATNRKSNRGLGSSLGGESDRPLEVGRSMTEDSGSAVDFVAQSPAHRQRAVEEIAYLLAEKRGFVPGYELDDWIEAERQVDAMLASTDV